MGRRTKAQQELRREAIKEFYLETGRLPSIQSIMEEFNITERTVRKDLKFVANEIKDPELVEKIRRKFLEQLQRRIPEMEDRNFVKLTKHFLAEKAEVKAEIDGTFNLIVPFRPSQEKPDEDANSQN